MNIDLENKIVIININEDDLNHGFPPDALRSILGEECPLSFGKEISLSSLNGITELDLLLNDTHYFISNYEDIHDIFVLGKKNGKEIEYIAYSMFGNVYILCEEDRSKGSLDEKCIERSIPLKLHPSVV